MKATEFLTAIPKEQRGPNFTYIYGDCQRIEAENAIREEIGGDLYPTGKYSPKVMDNLYSRLRTYMADREFVTQGEMEQLAQLMGVVYYEIHEA